MTALAQNSNTLASRPTAYRTLQVATAVQIYQGALVSVVTGTGYAKPSADASGEVVQGIAMQQSPPAGAGTGGSSGTYSVDIEPLPRFLEVNMASPDAVTAIGKFAYILDDNTVKIHAGTEYSCLGLIVGVPVAATAGRVIVDTTYRSAFVAST